MPITINGAAELGLIVDEYVPKQVPGSNCAGCGNAQYYVGKDLLSIPDSVLHFDPAAIVICCLKEEILPVIKQENVSFAAGLTLRGCLMEKINQRLISNNCQQCIGAHCGVFKMTNVETAPVETSLIATPNPSFMSDIFAPVLRLLKW